MPLYRVGFSGKAGVNTANTPIVDLRAINRAILIKEIGVNIQTAPTTAPVFALSRSTTRAGTPVSSTPIGMNANAPAADARLDTSWATAPAFTSTAIMNVSGVASAIGNGVIWDLLVAGLSPGIEVASGAGLLIQNLNAAGATLGSFSGYFVYEE